MQTINEAQIEQEIQRLGREIIEAAGHDEHSIHPADWFDARVMEWAMGDEALKTQLFRFVDVLPALRSPDEIARHLEEYFTAPDSEFPVAAQWGIHLLAHNPAGARAAAAMVRANAERMAHRFIAGDSLHAIIDAIRRMRRRRMAFTVDVLGEATVSDQEAVEYQGRYLESVESLSDEAATWSPDPLLDSGAGRPIPRVNVSVKISSLYSQIDPIAPESSSRAVRDRLRPILTLAKERGAAVTLDMEQYALKGLTIQVFRDILDEPAFRDWGDGGIALQSYLRETEQDVRDLSAWARARSAPIGVRLVRGAYWDYETVIAGQRDWPMPVFTEKRETDQSYETCLRLLLEAYPAVQTAAASHNVRSLAAAMALSHGLGLPDGATEIQMLYGMADPMKKILVERGWRLRVYTPFGALLPGMAYLVRRLLENTSNSSFLRQRFNENIPIADLLAPLAPVRHNLSPGLSPKREEGPITSAFVTHPPSSVLRPPSFSNDPERDFSQPEARLGMAEAVERVRGMLGKDYPAIIDGSPIWTDQCIVSRDPSRPSQVVGRTSSSSLKDAERAVQAASRALPEWRAAGADARAAVLRRAAAILRSRRDEMAAWEVFEVGKNWREADADVTESIDYLEYYASEAIRLGSPRPLGPTPGEVNTLLYDPRGIAVVIPPWNFPLAILTGMTSAALVAGNTVVLKPASQSPIIGAQLARIMQDAGLPPGALNFLPGPGGEIGDFLVDHPSVAMIAFTGSRAVGQRIFRRAAETHPGQPGLKYVIAEMGGKNAIIVDSDADLDDAVLGVTASAFGYQGQKCSACSRVICVGDVYQPFMSRLVEAARSLRIGPADDPAHWMGPVVEEKAEQKILEAVARGKQDHAPALEVDASGAGEGYFVGPVIFGEAQPDSPLAQEEIFGPVLSVMRAKDLDEALALANGVDYALTGGIYSRSPVHLERARREFRVGNLYINRKITGAIVGRQPFGGFKMSGTDVKAGGPDYLLHFMIARTITENTLRRGFAPPQGEIEHENDGL